MEIRVILAASPELEAILVKLASMVVGNAPAVVTNKLSDAATPVKKIAAKPAPAPVEEPEEDELEEDEVEAVSRAQVVEVAKALLAKDAKNGAKIKAILTRVANTTALKDVADAHLPAIFAQLKAL